MKLYVWEDCFYDYKAGLAVALAPDSETARELIVEKAGYRHEDLAERPLEFELDKPVAFFVHGGG